MMFMALVFQDGPHPPDMSSKASVPNTTQTQGCSNSAMEPSITTNNDDDPQPVNNRGSTEGASTTSTSSFLDEDQSTALNT